MKEFISKIAWAISRGFMWFGIGATVSQILAYVVIVLVVALGLFIIITDIRACFAPSKPPITPEQVQKINSQNAAERISALNEVVEQNAAVISTVSGRDTLANVEIEQRSAEQDARVKDAESKVISAKAGDGKDVTAEQILDLIEGK